MLQGKTAIITGVTRGIGKKIAEVYAKNHATLILNAREHTKVEKLAQKLRDEYNVEVIAFTFDITNSDEVKKAFQNLFKTVKKVDILVNNAGILEGSLLGMIGQNMIEKTYATNVYSIYDISQYAIRMMQRNKSGSIINMTSIMGVMGAEGQAVYSGSKAAVIGITKSMSKELASSNIRVNAIAPGFIDTDMIKELTDVKYEERLASIKMGRVGKTEDVANTALYLASELSSYVTGQVIGVDGGMVI